MLRRHENQPQQLQIGGVVFGSPRFLSSDQSSSANKFCNMHRENRLIVGCGYLGRRVARRWLNQGHSVSAITRSKQRAAEFARESITPIVADILQGESIPQWPHFDSVLFSVGFDRAAAYSIYEVYVGGLQNAIKSLAENPPRRFIYISSTGVYGDAGGDWIDEETPCNPSRDGGKACLAAESLLAASPLGPFSVILRLAGIYGPSRLPRKSDLLAGVPLNASEHGFLNLIHVDDAAAAIDLTLENCVPPKLFVLSDGSPVLRGDYYREAAQQLNAPPPLFEATTNSPRIARANSDKRVSNTRIVRELGFAPRYASYREGISASIREENHPG